MQSKGDDDSFTFTVGKLDAGMAILIGEKASLIEFPSLLLPPGVSSGSVVNIRVNRNDQQERRQRDEFDQLQEDILHTFGQQSPKAPNLRLRNVTQTSVTLEWDRLTLATATLLSLDIYRNGERLAPIPNPLHNTSTKLSGLDVNAEYTFHLVLKTSAGTFSSPVIKTRTHTINDTSGISVCFGHVHDAEMLEAAKKALENMKAKFSDRIQIDTTHYVCTDPRNPGDANAQPGTHGQGYSKAMQLSIPAVLPHWIFACHDQKKMVGISAFYIDQDPPNAATVRQSIDKVLGKQASSASSGSSATDQASEAAAADTSVSSTATVPPPPLEKDDVPTTSARDADQGEVAAPETTGSALGLALTDEEPTQSRPTPIITHSAPSEDGDAEPSSTQHPDEDDAATPTMASAPRVVITSSESDGQISAPAATDSNEHHSEGLHADGDDEDGDGEMDDVSLGGGTNADDEEVDEADGRVF